MAERERYNMLELTPWQVKEYMEKTQTIMIPIGSCEKHGDHLPLGTDSFITMGVVQRAAALAKVVHTPLIPVGYSPHHMGRLGEGSGTPTFSAATYRGIMYDMARSMIFHGFSRIVFVSHHGSNTKLIDDTMRRIHYQTGAFVCFYKTPTERECNVIADIITGKPEETPGWHSGEVETAMIKAWDESMVYMDRAGKDSAHAPEWMGKAFSKGDGTATVKFQETENIFVPMEHHEYCDTATLGDPFAGTKEKGQKLYQRGAEHLAAFLEEVKKFPAEVTLRDFPERA